MRISVGGFFSSTQEWERKCRRQYCLLQVMHVSSVFSSWRSSPGGKQSWQARHFMGRVLVGITSMAFKVVCAVYLCTSNALFKPAMMAPFETSMAFVVFGIRFPTPHLSYPLLDIPLFPVDTEYRVFPAFRKFLRPFAWWHHRGHRVE